MTDNTEDKVAVEEKEKTLFETLYATNVNDKVEKKKDLSYLSWSYGWSAVKKVDPNANYTIHENSEGLPYFISPLGIDCKVSVTIKGLTHTMRLPVMDGANKAMKDVDYTYKTQYGEKSVNAATMFDVNKTIMRCLVKAIAMHGLGLYIYAGEDLPEGEEKPETPKKELKTTETGSTEKPVGTRFRRGAK